MSAQAQPKFDNLQDWLRLVAEFAAANPHYANKNGTANVYHIVTAAAELGYEVITDDNWDEVAQRLYRRVTENAQGETQPEKGEQPAEAQDRPQPQAHARTWTEAPASANVKVGFRGRDWQFTIRDDTVQGVFEKAIALSEWLDKSQGAQKPKSVSPAVQPPFSAPTAPPMPQAQLAGHELRCAMIEVCESFKGKKLQLKFHCNGEEHPLTFTRGINDMVALLAPLGLTAANLTMGAKHSRECIITWTQNGQYKNVVSVRPA